MFATSSTSEILEFINSISRNNKIEIYSHLYESALKELENRCDKMAILYRYQNTFKDVQDDLNE